MRIGIKDKDRDEKQGQVISGKQSERDCESRRGKGMKNKVRIISGNQLE